jgi:hypothetical protein
MTDDLLTGLVFVAFILAVFSLGVSVGAASGKRR